MLACANAGMPACKEGGTMSEKPARQPMTDGEREILFQIQQLQAKWLDTMEMFSQREFTRYERMEQVRQEGKDLAAKAQAATLSQMVDFREECLIRIAECTAEQLRQYRQLALMSKTIATLTQEVHDLREQLTKDRLF
jgi:hypothetical protein